MPLNLSNNALAALKIGEKNILNAYVGINQIFPNESSITAAAFDNAGSNITNAVQNQPYTVSGDVGSSFTVLGSLGATGLAGTQVLSVSPTTYQLAIAANGACGAGVRNPTATISTQGSTAFDPVGLTTTSNVIQAAGPVNVTVTGGHTIAVASVITRNTVTIGGQVNWSTGSKFSIVWTTAVSNSPTKQVVSEISGSGGTWSAPSATYSIDAGGQSVTSNAAFQTSESGASAEWTYTGSYAPSFNFQVTKTSTVPCATGLNTQATGNQFP